MSKEPLLKLVVAAALGRMLGTLALESVRGKNTKEGWILWLLLILGFGLFTTDPIIKKKRKLNSLDGLGATKGTIKRDPQPIIEQAKAEELKRDLSEDALYLSLSPARALAQKAVQKATPKTITTEQKVEAIVEQVLIKHGLLSPNPSWDRIF